MTKGDNEHFRVVILISGIEILRDFFLGLKIIHGIERGEFGFHYRLLITLLSILLIALGLSAYDSAFAAETADVCLNYDGTQTHAEITAKGFVTDDSGDCRLALNHEAFASMGVDRIRMAGRSGANIPVAVIDSGFRVTHEAIAAQVQSVAAYHDLNENYRLDDGEKILGDAAKIVAAHGTGVAALLAGQGVGIAPGAGLWVKAAGDENPYTRDLAIATIDALEAEGIGILNHSIDLFSDGLIYRSAQDDETGILPALAASRAVIVTAAGNTGLDLSGSLDYAHSQVPALTCFLDVPEEAAHVLFVGIYDETEQDIALDSNYPGYRTNVQARFLTVTGTSLDTASSGSDSAYRNVGGTSFGTPLIAGALAILREAGPRLTPPEAAGILLQTARRPAEAGYGQTCTSDTDLGTFAADCGAMKLGMGILDLPAALAQAETSTGNGFDAYFDSHGGLLHIPVVDAGELGLYRVSLRLAGMDAGYTPGYVFELIEVLPATGTPSATYNVQTGVLSLPHVVADDVIYAAVLTLLPDKEGMRFAVSGL